MPLYYTHGECFDQSSSEYQNGNKYRDSHQDTMKKLRDTGTVIPTWDVSQTTTPNNLREPCRKGARKIIRYR